MRPLHKSDGARAPLFDRLIDDNPGTPGEPMPKIYLDIEGLADSVEREVRTLLNSRCPLTEVEIDYDARTVIDYGLIDLSGFFTADLQDQRRLSQHIARTIAAYEPRLAKVAVTVERLHREVRALDVVIAGEMRVGEIVHPIAFPVRIAPPGEGDGAEAAL
ncbi:MAG: type VI secretion system baseplate subunit TssE [Marivibrio sp.]|uniref:type VI secretion system baseplate subunit TssE n=1 Tax=Marivibrio sp. TaxID=2039719 RepID=UPI0032EC941D